MSSGTATAVGVESFACGPGANTSGGYAAALGASASAGGNGTAVGAGAEAGHQGTAIGVSSSGLGLGSVAVGSLSSAAAFASAIGNFSKANGEYSVAIGASAEADSNSSIAIGEGSKAGESGGTYNIAMGVGAVAGGGTNPANSAVAIGDGSTANANGALALGQSTTANHDSSVAIGVGASTSRAYQMTLGTSQSTYTLTGLASSASLAAQTGPIHFVTSDTGGNLAVSAFDVSTLATTASVEGLRSDIGATRTEARQGIAAAIAMSSAAMPSAPGRTSWAANVGHFKGETAFGGSLSHRLDFDNPVAISLGYSYGGGDSHAARFGMMGEF
ncbi:hypothetical protein [Aminobacter anthyllidis]